MLKPIIQTKQIPAETLNKKARRLKKSTKMFNKAANAYANILDSAIKDHIEKLGKIGTPNRTVRTGCNDIRTAYINVLTAALNMKSSDYILGEAKEQFEAAIKSLKQAISRSLIMLK